MTNESRRAFEEHRFNKLNKYVCDTVNGEYLEYDVQDGWLTWQASEARILALLESSEFLEFMVEKLIYKTSAQDLIEAIKQRIKQGE